jgi:hypothetical protein
MAAKKSSLLDLFDLSDILEIAGEKLLPRLPAFLKRVFKTEEKQLKYRKVALKIRNTLLKIYPLDTFPVE